MVDFETLVGAGILGTALAVIGSFAWRSLGLRARRVDQGSTGTGCAGCGHAGSCALFPGRVTMAGKLPAGTPSPSPGVRLPAGPRGRGFPRAGS